MMGIAPKSKRLIIPVIYQFEKAIRLAKYHFEFPMNLFGDFIKYILINISTTVKQLYYY